MVYIEEHEYATISGIEETIPDFDRLRWECSKLLDNATTGIDGYKKLKNAFPTDEDDAEAVKRCLCKLIDLRRQIEDAEKSALAAQSYIQREDGTVMSKKVTSISSGSESISYALNNTGDATAISAAVSDRSARDALYRSTIEEYLSGTADANGINLLYMGRYPRV